MSRGKPLSDRDWRPADLAGALARIARGAAARDAAATPGFPQDAVDELRSAGALGWNARPGTPRPPAQLELALVRDVAAADGSVGRIFDGHLNAVERLAVQAPALLRERELPAIAAGELLCGVWGGDPIPGEGPPAAVVIAAGREVLRGVKTFCSGAGGLHRAAVLARDMTADPAAAGPPVLVWIDAADERRVEVDPSWYRSRGLVASVSHRVVFHDAPVLARLGGPGAISLHPWFHRDALRTAASWAGMADTALGGALAALAQRPARGDLEGLAAGRMLTAHATIDAWLAKAALAMDRDGADLTGDGNPTGPLMDPDKLAAVALHGRAAIADACATLLSEAARACGSRPFVRADALDRARRDLEVFLLQHRLDPMLARAGTAAIERI